MERDKVPEHPPATGRLAFRLWQIDDVDRFHAICSQPDVMRYVADGRTWSVAQSAEFIRNCIHRQQVQGYCQWPLLHKSDRRLAGFCGYADSQHGVEIGWRLAPEYWGQGLATEAARTVLDFGVSVLGFPRVTATVQAENGASIRVIEKLGLRLVERFSRGSTAVLRYSSQPR